MPCTPRGFFFTGTDSLAWETTCVGVNTGTTLLFAGTGGLRKQYYPAGQVGNLPVAEQTRWNHFAAAAAFSMAVLLF